MVTKTRELFTTVSTEGALLPPDILQRVTDGDSDLGGLHPQDYHLYGERLNEATNRAWNRLQGAWQAFKQAQGRLPEDDLGTTITRERWLMVLFNALDYGRLDSATAVDIDGKSYAISHRYKDVPIHLLSYKVKLDERTKGVAGAAAGSPHSMMQVFLNRKDEHLWGILSNGYQLRILRDNLSLTRQAYIEFDLEAMMEGEVYSDFVLLYLLCHQSRVEADNINHYWLEKWRKAAEEQGKRALEDLRTGVEKAINCLGMGFLDHPHNTALRDALADGALDKQDYYRELLRLVYRMLFLFVAEDRNLLHLPDTTEQERAIFQHYSTNKLRDISANLRGTRHHDLYESLRLVMRLLGGEREGAEGLGLPVLGSFLFSDDAMLHLMNAKIANRDLLEAVRAISTVEDTEIRRLRRVDFKNLGSEELGSVYESLLELHPDINIPARTFSLATAGGNERKTTGSYYTPTSLINALLDSALDPVLDETIGAGGTRDEIVGRILELKVVDPACGSGHFLIAAANRMAKRLATVRTGEDEPTPEHVTEAKRDVIANCIYGVDLNEMAVELCKVNLWLESIDPGKPLTFLDSRIQHGNSLLGTTPALMAGGIPENAFPSKSGLIEGDDNKIVSGLRTRNRNELKDRQTGQKSMFDYMEAPTDYFKLSHDFNKLAQMPDNDIHAVRTKERMFAALAKDKEYINGKFLADLWCAVFVWMKAENATFAEGTPVPAPPTDADFRRIQEDPDNERYEPLRRYVAYLADRYDFFHWHMTYPEIFDIPPQGVPTANEVTGWDGGFDVVLGNPPWERIKLQEKEWFAERVPEIASAPNASARKKMIKALKEESPLIYADFKADLRKAIGESYFIRFSQHYPLCGRGDVNTYTIFAETSRQLMSEIGRAGIIVPSGIATDATTQYFFNDLMQSHSLSSFYDFENRQGIFAGVHRSFRFCLMTMTGTTAPLTEFVFFAHQVSDLEDKFKRFTLTADEIAMLNPNTGTMATFRSQKDAEITKEIYRRIPILIREASPPLPVRDERLGEGDLGGEGYNHWDIRFSTMFHMSSDSDKFRTHEELSSAGYQLEGNHFVREDERYLPLYEAKMMHQFTHRWATYDADGNTRDMSLDELENPHAVVIPRYWVDENEITKRFEFWNKNWLLGFREITNTTNERTFINTPISGVSVGHKMPLLFIAKETMLSISFIGMMNSHILDYSIRQKLGGTSLTYFVVKQLPVIPPHTYTQELLDFIVPRVLELTYTAWDLQAFAQDVGYAGAPFVWDDERRFWLRSELDALYFHLYGINRDDVDYIMETFPIVKRKDIKATSDENGEGGTYRTKDAILAIYDEMSNLPTIDVPAPKGEGSINIPDVSQYQPALNPPPASPEVAHEDTRGE